MSVEQQIVKKIEVSKLVLWSENPRDPIPGEAASTILNETIIQRALADKKQKWELQKLAKQMGRTYDYSELPIVVYHGDNPVVYDGNRRMILAKLRQCYTKTIPVPFELPEVEPEMYCCVCPKEMALDSVWRKHSSNGSWGQLERDMFEYRFMKRSPSLFMQINEATGGMIEKTPNLNQRHVRDEVLTEQNLAAIGLKIHESKLLSKHSPEETEKILQAIANVIGIMQTTRNDRGELRGPIESLVGTILAANETKDFKPVSIVHEIKGLSAPKASPKRTRRTKDDHAIPLFGGDLYLKPGLVSNMYRDICDLDIFYNKNKSLLSSTFPSLIRMSLRLLCEATSKRPNTKGMADFLNKNFPTAKKQLDQDQQTFLYNQSVTPTNIVGMFETAGHNYAGMSNYQQTIAMSLILAPLLTQYYGKTNESKTL